MSGSCPLSIEVRQLTHQSLVTLVAPPRIRPIRPIPDRLPRGHRRAFCSRGGNTLWRRLKSPCYGAPHRESRVLAAGSQGLAAAVKIFCLPAAAGQLPVKATRQLPEKVREIPLSKNVSFNEKQRQCIIACGARCSYCLRRASLRGSTRFK